MTSGLVKNMVSNIPAVQKEEIDFNMAEIFSFLERETGIRISQNRRKETWNNIINRSSKKRFTSLKGYYDFLCSSKGREELDDIIDTITVGETYFLRHSNHWEAFQKHILPALSDSRDNGGPLHLKFWSAACSTGEEAYSIAMMLTQYFSCLDNIKIEIWATDINQQSLKKARSGNYTAHSFRGVDVSYINNFFTKTGNRFKIRDEIRQMVKFERVNLNNPAVFDKKYRRFDAIFCRNVLMYFDTEKSKRTVEALSGCLKNKGFLLLGHAEGAMAHTRLFEPVKCCETIIYQKKSGVKPFPTSSVQLTKPLVITPEKKQVKFNGGRIQGSVSPVLNTKKRSNPLLSSPKKTIRKTIKKSIPSGTCPGGKECTRYDDALEYYYREEYRQALSLLEKQGADLKNRFKPNLLKAIVLLNMSDLEAVQICLEQLLEIYDVSPEVHMLKALLYEAQNDFSGAIKANHAAVFAGKRFFAPQFRLGHIHQEMKNTKKARKHFTNALELLKKDDEDRIKLFFGNVSQKMLRGICERRLR